MNLKTTICSFLLVTTFYGGTSYAAQVVHECSAEKFMRCPSFHVNRTIGEHTNIGGGIGGFTRSKGKWTITVSYGPIEKCAKVSLFLTMGPVDFDREYERVFMNGGGTITDSGSFVHKIDDLESALRVKGSCYVPADEPQHTGAESTERDELDVERERLALEEERERLAMQEDRERLALDEERKRLEEEQRLEEERERRRLAQLRRERERRRLARQRELERKRRLELSRQRERARRLAQQRREQERLRAQRESEADDAAAAIGLLGAFLHGLSGGSASPGGMGFVRRPSSGSSGGGGSSCEQARRRGARVIQSQRMSTGSQCSISRSALRMYQTARRYLANGGCPAHEVRQYDRAIAQTRRRVRAACY